MKAILTYHSIDPSGSVISVAPDRWREHARWLAGGAVRVVSLEELVRLPADADAVAVTFDDAFANFASLAWPPLREHRLPVTVFAVSDRAGGTNAWGGRDEPGIPTLPLLDWDTLGRLTEEGVAVGGHSRSHPDLRAVDAAALDDELAGCAARIEAETGRPPSAFAYPYGLTDARVRAAVAATYQVACTTELRALDPRDAPHALPRLDAYYWREPGMLERWGTPAFRRHLWLRARGRQVRRTLAALGARP